MNIEIRSITWKKGKLMLQRELTESQCRVALNVMRCAIGIMMIPAIILAFKTFVEIFLLISATAMLVPVLDRLRLRGLDRKGIAGVLVLFYLALVIIGMYTVLPHVAKGAIESVAAMTLFWQDLPVQFERGWAWAHEILQAWFHVDAEQMRAAQAWVKDHVGSVALQGASTFAWLGGMFVRGSFTAAIGFVLPLIILFVYAYWTKETEVACRVMRRLIPEPYDAIVLRWWTIFITGGTRLLGAVGVMMLGFIAFYIVTLVIFKIAGYPMTISKAVFFGIVLGVVGGIPTIGGVLNWGLSGIIGFTVFGFGNYGAMFLIVLAIAVREVEAWYVTPVLLGERVEFTPLGTLMCFLIGLTVWGFTFTAVAVSLLLIPFFTACMVLMDEVRNALRPKITEKAESGIAAAYLSQAT